jgi:cell division transport system permease protein
MQDIIHAGQIARIAAVSLFALMALAAAAVIAFATRAGLSARHDVVEIMHLTGATDGFIANLFQARFAAMAALAGLLGGAAAALLAAGIRLLGGGYGLIPVLPIHWLDLLVALPSPLIAGLVAAIAARVTALGLIRAMP